MLIVVYFSMICVEEINQYSFETIYTLSVGNKSHILSHLFYSPFTGNRVCASSFFNHSLITLTACVFSYQTITLVADNSNQGRLKACRGLYAGEII